LRRHVYVKQTDFFFIFLLFVESRLPEIEDPLQNPYILVGDEKRLNCFINKFDDVCKEASDVATWPELGYWLVGIVF